MLIYDRLIDILSFETLRRYLPNLKDNVTYLKEVLIREIIVQSAIVLPWLAYIKMKF